MNRYGKRCVLYPRVSTEMQVDGYSLEGQKTMLTRFADREEMVIVDTYEDAGKSGKSIEGRPAFQKMLRDIEEGLDIDYVLVYKLSRFGRNAADILNSLELIQSYGVNLICIEEGIDSSQTSGKLLISVLSAVAEIERENIIEQTMNGRREKARQGGWNGGFAPYGYALVDNKLVIAEAEAVAIRRIFELYTSSEIGLGGVANQLNLEGIRKIPRQNGTLEDWTGHFIKLILDNPVYYGKIAYGRRTKEKVKGTKNDYQMKRNDDYILTDGQHEGIVSEEVWEKAHAKRLRTGVKQPSKIGRDRVHLLSGLLKCPVCGSPMYTNKHAWTNKDGTYKEVYYYVCSRNRMVRGKHCEYKAMLKKTDIEPMVIEAIREIVRNKEYAQAIKKRIGVQIDTKAVDKELEGYRAKLKEVDLNKSRLEREIDNLPIDTKYRERKLHDMTLRLDSLYDIIVELEEKIEDAMMRRDAIAQQAITLEGIYKIMVNFDCVYNIISDEEKRAVVTALIKEIELYRNDESECPLKRIGLNFPVFKDGKEVSELLWDKGNTVDTWCTVTWTSADSSVIKIGSAPYYPYYSPYNTTVIPGKLDQDVTLTAALVCNSVDGVAVTKEFTVCVKGDPDAQDITELLQAKLDAGLKDPGLTDDVTGDKIDPANVTSSGIQFPTTRDFKIDGKYYPVTIKSSNPNVIKTFDVNNAARVEVLRPMPGEDPVKVTVTVTITEKATGKFASRDIELTVQPLVNEEIDRELELMELVKAHYFDGIRNANTSPDDIQTDLHTFQEAYLNDDGELVWVYNYKDVTGKGIAPSEMDGWQAAEQWRLFKSSNPKVITHENLLVTRDKEHKLVTITSWLSSERFAELAKKYPDDKRLSQLVNQPVSVQLQVTGTDPTSDKPIEDLYAVYFTLSDNGSEWFSCKLDKLPEGTSALDVLHKALASHGYSASGSTYISAISGPNGTLKEKDRGPNSGWMYSVNGSIASVTMNQYFVSDGDSIEMFYTDDYTKLGHSGEYTPDDVIDLIDAIGTVTKRSGDDIAAARKSYDILTDEEKKQVTNYGTLLAAEKAYADILKKAAKELGDIYKTTGDYIEKLPGDELNAFGSEWYILGLARSGRKVFDDYYKAIEKYVSENIDENGRLDEKRATDNAKLVLVLSALDKDVTDVGGHDLLKALSDMDYVTQQGLSGAIYALLAFDCRGYDVPSADKNVEQTSREGLVKYILDKQLKDGGWAYSGDKAEPDMTAMALQALAAYYKTDAKVKEAADKAVTCLSKLQNTTGGYDSYGSVNSESAAQVITALTALGIDPDNDARFVKNGASVLDSLCGFYVDGGGFRHVSDGKLDPTATAQGYYALAAYYRFAGSQTALYDMTDLDTVEKAA